MTYELFNPVVSELSDKVLSARMSKGLSQPAFARLVGVDARTIGNLETGRTKSVKLKFVPALARELELDPGALIALFPKKSSSNGKHVVIERSSRPTSTHLHLKIAASEWVELEGEAFIPGDAHASIVIRIAGDSMEPKYRDGRIVHFQVLDPTEDSPMPGVDYFFIRNDNHGTFKRLVSIDDDGVTMRALNPKYKKQLQCSRHELVMVAEARWFVEEIPED